MTFLVEYGGGPAIRVSRFVVLEEPLAAGDIHRGLDPEGGGARRWWRALSAEAGRHGQPSMLWTGRGVGAEEAERIGLVTQVFDDATC
jgi:enoyl-CoA hydratase/carnithine racemase